MVVLGIDPGLANLGYGIIRQQGSELQPLDFGTIRTESSRPQAERLLKIHDAIDAFFDIHHPDAVVLEELFFGKNSSTALLVGQALGVVQLVAAKHAVAVQLYTPLQIKQSVVGHGRATKHQIQQMVRMLLGMLHAPTSDHAADALAVAICHIHSLKMHPYVKA